MSLTLRGIMRECGICNGTGVMHLDKGKYRVTCDFCNLSTVDVDTEYEAVRCWDEAQDGIDRRYDYAAHVLATKDLRHIQSFMAEADYNMFIEFCKLNLETRNSWESFKGNISLQLKIIDLSGENLMKRVRTIQNELGI